MHRSTATTIRLSLVSRVDVSSPNDDRHFPFVIFTNIDLQGVPVVHAILVQKVSQLRDKMFVSPISRMPAIALRLFMKLTPSFSRRLAACRIVWHRLAFINGTPLSAHRSATI